MNTEVEMKKNTDRTPMILTGKLMYCFYTKKIRP